jgi:hypothetical protein
MGGDTSSYSARRGSRGLSDLDDKICTIIIEEILLNLVEPDFASNPGLGENNQYQRRSLKNRISGWELLEKKFENRISGWELSERKFENRIPGWELSEKKSENRISGWELSEKAFGNRISVCGLSGKKFQDRVTWLSAIRAEVSKGFGQV